MYFGRIVQVINYTYCVEHNIGLFKIELHLYMYAACIDPLHVCYMYRPFLRPSSGMAIQKSYKGRYYKIALRGALVYSTVFL